MDQISSTFISFTNLMDQNIRGVQIGCYSVACIGLTVALRKVRPFSKFKKPSDIPNHFIKERRELTGVVTRIEPNGALLMIQHKPLVDIPLIPSGQLPIKISGVNVTGLGLNWLQAIVAGSEVKFLPIAKEKDFVQCEVLLLQHSKDKKLHEINIGENLVKIGFGLPENIEKPFTDDPSFLAYYNSLKRAQKYAIRKQLGLKYYVQPTKEVLVYLYRILSNRLSYLANRISRQAPKVPNKLHKIYIA
ncbi:hypothetical protein NQ317_014247 [Molorchus minor]|uniref:Ribosomal protein S1 n=1 Tax=Molorchus minor TaxID=1323400 RepID=A0ABQ9J7M5_9CUCU|nr:hypothetical protein NQ317_014247 [Molorchus minor]